MTSSCPRALLLTGVAGVGKSTVADAIGGILTATGLATAVVDADALAQFGPPPTRGFHDHLKCANLAAVWPNYRAAGARFVVVSAAIDSASLRDRYAGSLAGCAVQTVRLIAPTDTIRDRLHGRDNGPKLARHLTTLADQEARLSAIALEDFTVANDRPITVVAREVITRAGWLAEAG